MTPLITRVGLILDDDNRFHGRSVARAWERDITAASDWLAVVLGASLTASTRETLRIIAVCLTSPDARVWPLKLTRLLASWGDPVAGFFAAQLVTSGVQVMGPGTVTAAAEALSALAEASRSTATTWTEALAAVRARHQGRVPGFGVPFRAEDERLVAMRPLVRAAGLDDRAHWRLHERVVADLSPVPPNVALGVAALLLDVGVAPAHAGIALSQLMSHVFLGHALEAARSDAALHDLGPEHVEYVGAPPRHSGRGGEGGR